MKRLMVLGFLIIQGNNVECIMRQGLPVIKKGAQEVVERAYNWYRRPRGNFSTNSENNTKPKGLQKGVEEIVNKLVVIPGVIPGINGEETPIYTKSFYPGVKYYTTLSFVKEVKNPGQRKGEQVKYQYDDNLSANVDQILILFEKEFIKAEEQLLTGQILKFSPQVLFERLLNEKLPDELKDNVKRHISN